MIILLKWDLLYSLVTNWAVCKCYHNFKTVHVLLLFLSC